MSFTSSCKETGQSTLPREIYIDTVSLACLQPQPTVCKQSGTFFVPDIFYMHNSSNFQTHTQMFRLDPIDKQFINICAVHCLGVGTGGGVALCLLLTTATIIALACKGVHLGECLNKIAIQSISLGLI